jgi:hypothetical protein
LAKTSAPSVSIDSLNSISSTPATSRVSASRPSSKRHFILPHPCRFQSPIDAPTADAQRRRDLRHGSPLSEEFRRLVILEPR